MAIIRQRTRWGFAQQMRWLVDEAYSGVQVILLVLDNLNTLRVAPLYQTFPAAEDRRIAKRLEFHDTPRPGGRLDPGTGAPSTAATDPHLLPRRCVVERTFGWLKLQQRLSKVYESLRKTAETWICFAISNGLWPAR